MPTVAKTVEWETPQPFFDALASEFHFTLDVAATADNAKCARFFSREDDGLAQDWAREVCWMNPPYGREASAWVAKAYSESQRGATVVCLLPARTDTRWWHDYATKASELRFVKGRLKFGGQKAAAPFPSVVLIFRPRGVHQ